MHASFSTRGANVLFVIVGGSADPSDQNMAAIRAHVAQVMSATLCDSVIHDHIMANQGRDAGRCASEFLVTRVQLTHCGPPVF